MGNDEVCSFLADVLPKAALNDDVGARILAFLPIEDLISAACVSKQWNKLVKDDVLWLQRLKLCFSDHTDEVQNSGFNTCKR